jgi:hypothetical protein
MLYRKVVRKAVAETEESGRGDRTRVLKMEAASSSETVVSTYNTI